MRKYVRIEGDRVIEAREFPDGIDMASAFHPSIVWVECEEFPEMGSTYDAESGTFASPEAPAVDPVAEARATLAALDAVLPRCVEDIIDALAIEPDLPDIMVERLLAKRAARAVIRGE